VLFILLRSAFSVRVHQSKFGSAFVVPSSAIRQANAEPNSEREHELRSEKIEA